MLEVLREARGIVESGWGTTNPDTSIDDAARDAAMALISRDLITSEEFDLLVGPWETVLGKEYTR